MVFRKNLFKIKSHYESGPKSFNVSVNEFADMTQEEFKAKMLTVKVEDATKNVKELPTDNLPEDINWIDKNIVNPVKN